jgi:hypothetical protein
VSVVQCGLGFCHYAIKTLLIDGSADPRHHDLFREIGMKVKPFASKEPGAESE